MPYEYWCAHCEAVSPARRDHREAAETDLDEHRTAAHGGLAPAAGDGVRRVHSAARGDGVLPDRSCLFIAFMLALVLANCWGR
ncbi:hypothetical protein SGFS_065610 [Streptomyces graminofaciens]|jgi:hypothetical protein|uniref:Uncharacterized protein n=1 Tax=Streptomyces graminofaciens TaxID=68212 RepID=A0ABN5VT82_9ACTN|nr:hypothetical protein [Streptomyces graminofaciens]BBC35267.1 hypothetical protein SGFS_065610 [Streptomyces graminofaciens]